MVHRPHRGRRPLTKAMLLPLPTVQVQRMQLKHHLALATHRNQNGSASTLATLFNVLYLSFHLRDLAGETDPDFYARVEVKLTACATRAEQGDWSLCDDERVLLEQLLATHDAQLAATPMHRYLDAWERVDAATRSGERSPILAAISP